MLRLSDLPIIVSLEVHAGSEQQEIMVEIMQQTWEGLLLMHSVGDNDALPSLEEMRKRILVKVKAAPQGGSVAEPILSLDLKKSGSSSDDEPSGVDEKSMSPQNAKSKSKIIDPLSAMGIYTRAYHFKKFNSPEAKISNHVFSLSEKKLGEMDEANTSELFLHNMDYMMRAFPSGTRVSSSNLDPSALWQKGVQMVALNWQKFDAVGDSMFARK